MDRLLNFTSLLSVLLAILVLASVRRAHIRVEYSVSWLAAAAALFLMSRSGGVLGEVARHLGLAYAPMALVLMAGVVFLLIFFRFSVIISKLRDDNVALAQRLAVLEYRLEQSHRP